VENINAIEFEKGFISWSCDRDGKLESLSLNRSFPLEAPSSGNLLSKQASSSIKSSLLAFLSGKDPEWDVEIAWKGPAFYQLIWKTLLEKVPRGKTITYGALAGLAGRPRASRAVGTAMARNPWAIIVPCHRVLSEKGLGGYFGGLDWKTRFLGLEGVY